MGHRERVPMPTQIITGTSLPLSGTGNSPKLPRMLTESEQNETQCESTALAAELGEGRRRGLPGSRTRFKVMSKKSGRFGRNSSQKLLEGRGWQWTECTWLIKASSTDPNYRSGRPRRSPPPDRVGPPWRGRLLVVGSDTVCSALTASAGFLRPNPQSSAMA